MPAPLVGQAEGTQGRGEGGVPRVECVRGFVALEASLGPGGGAALERSPFSGLDWLRVLSRWGMAQGGPREPTFVVVRFGDELRPALILPLDEGPGGARRPGAPASAFANYYAPVFELPAHPEPDPESIAALVQSLRRGPASVLDLGPCASEDPLNSMLESALRAHGYFVRRYFRFGNWIVRRQGRNYEQYLRERPGTLRSTITRRARRMERAGGGHVRVYVSEAEAAEATHSYQQVYERSWKQPEPSPDFVPALIRLAARRGWLRCGVLQFDGQPVAVQLWLVDRGRAYIYKLAYDEDFRQYSPGTLLSAHMFRRAFDEDAVDLVDYLIGDDAYKRLWMEERRERYGLLVADLRTVAGLAVAGRETLFGIGRRLLGRVPSRPDREVSDSGMHVT